jgi:hypothetical protein
MTIEKIESNAMGSLWLKDSPTHKNSQQIPPLS